jgi:DNA polymerase-3 subunit alpha
VQTSRAGFALEGDAVRWGLAGIRGVGDRDAQAIVAARGQVPFANLDDFLDRIRARVGRKALEALALAGALDGLAPTRAEALARIRRGRDGGQASLLSLLETAHLPEMPRRELLAGERAALGFYLSGHPLEGVAAQARLRTLLDAPAAPRGPVEVAAVALSVERKRTRQGHRLTVVRLSDPSASVEATAFDEAIGGIPVVEDQAYRVSLQAEDRDGIRRFRIRALTPLQA